MKYVKTHDGGIRIEITVTPNARKTEIVGVHNEMLKLKIHAPPVDGKANEEIIRFFAELFGRKKNEVDILRGERGHHKSVYVARLVLIEAIDILQKALAPS